MVTEMTVIAKIHNRNGSWMRFERACFGFMSYIDQWDRDCIQNHSVSSDMVYSDINGNEEGVPWFESGNLKTLEYLVYVDSDIAPTIREAIAGLPQYYGDVKIEERERDYWSFHFNLVDVCMQVPVIAGMMLRNVCDYSGCQNTYLRLIKEGFTPTVAFVLSQAYWFSHNALNQKNSRFYRVDGSDDTIFDRCARLCDLYAMLNGKYGDAWQGHYGDTANGYGRYGEYNGDRGPTSKRTTFRKTLTSMTLITSDYSNSPLLNDAEAMGMLNPPPMQPGAMVSRTQYLIDSFIEAMRKHFSEYMK